MFAKNLKYLREKNDMEQIELAKRLGRKSSSSVSEWEKGKYTPKIGVINDIAEIFRVSISDLMDKDLTQASTTLSLVTEATAKLDESRQTIVLNVARKELAEQEQEKQNNVISIEEHRRKRLQQKKAKICHAGAVSAGTGEYLGDETIETIELPEDMIPVVADFCLTINGKSMEPIFADHSYVFVEKQAELASGSIGVVVVNGEAFLKRIWFEDDHARLESFNDDYEDIIVTEDDEFKIIGKVVM
ncbi:S24 family peptidase [Enterococcus sp. AZ128]|uniref:S24 family peptidase n=1 Tax=Enterococcus sp. AZ128 TaxID=2774630 RepID=UPI003F238C8B